MASILEELTSDAVWLEYLDYKLSKQHLSKCEEKELREFIEKKEYKAVTDHLLDGDYFFSPPLKRSINKSGTSKKRIIYTYQKAESFTLKVMAFLLYRYDSDISDNCYSFRVNSSAQTAIKKILKTNSLKNMCCLKVDISNYFNSIPANKLCLVLKDFLSDDPTLYNFLEKLLLANTATEDGVLITENRGAMAGTPISPFLANIYLKKLDEYYKEKNIPYFRYSDDIILFMPNYEECLVELDYISEFLDSYGLYINHEKATISPAHTPWEFLGICYNDGVIDLSSTTKMKLKAKIRRKAHALYRWRRRKGATFTQTAKVLIRVFNKKFYDDTEENFFTWSRWFFPIINSDEGLKELDAYLISYIRYLYKGRHYKGNYKITYKDIKALGYRSLVNEYYKSKEA